MKYCPLKMKEIPLLETAFFVQLPYTLEEVNKKSDHYIQNS